MHLVSDSLFNPASIKLPTPSLTVLPPVDEGGVCIFTPLMLPPPIFYSTRTITNQRKFGKLAIWQKLELLPVRQRFRKPFSVKRQLKATKIVSTDPRTNASVKEKN